MGFNTLAQNSVIAGTSNTLRKRIQSERLQPGHQHGHSNEENIMAALQPDPAAIAGAFDTLRIQAERMVGPLQDVQNIMAAIQNVGQQVQALGQQVCALR
jgi:Tfp pilus assembly protein PilP